MKFKFSEMHLYRCWKGRAEVGQSWFVSAVLGLDFLFIR